MWWTDDKTNVSFQCFQEHYERNNWFLGIEHRENKRSHWNSWLYTAQNCTRHVKNIARVTRTSAAEANGKRAWNIYQPRSEYRNDTRVSRENQFAFDHPNGSSDYFPLLFSLSLSLVSNKFNCIFSINYNYFC